jgi:predicted lipase
MQNKMQNAALQSQDNPHKIYQEQIIGVPSVISSQISKNAPKQLIKKQRKGKLIEPSSVEHFWSRYSKQKLLIN